METKQFKCKYCGYTFSNEEGKLRCEKMCDNMIKAYMEVNKMDRKEAHETFLMECL